jgi:hypothetical protein
MNKLLVVFCATLMIICAGSISAMDMKTYQELLFEAEHSRDKELKKAVLLFKKKGLVRKTSKKSETGAVSKKNADCHIFFNQKFIDNALRQDMVAKQFPKELLKVAALLEKDGIRVTGKLDGPIFLNPGFSSFIQLNWLKKNAFMINISEIKVSGIKVTLFNRLISGYIIKALNRAFPKDCKTRVVSRKKGVIRIEVCVNPEGFAPGISKFCFISAAGMSNGMLYFGMGTPMMKKSRR